MSTSGGIAAWPPVTAVRPAAGLLDPQPFIAGDPRLAGWEFESPATDVLGELVAAAAANDVSGALAVVATLTDSAVALRDLYRRPLAVAEPRQAAHPTPPWQWATGPCQPDREMLIGSSSALLGSLAFRRPRGGATMPLAVRRAVHDVLAVLLMAREATQRAAEAEQRVALLSCLAGSDEDDDPHEEPRAAGGGPRSDRYRPVIVSPVESRDGEPVPRHAEVVGRLRAALDRHPLLSGGQFAQLGRRVVVLYPQRGSEPPRKHAAAWQRAMAALAPMRCRVVVGLPGTPGRSMRSAYQTARWLAELQSQEQEALALPEVAVVDELGVLAATVGPAWGKQLGSFITRVLADVIGNHRFGGDMLNTLHAYLVCGNSSTEAARLLHLSPSSMKYRMRVIREILDDRLDNHDTVFELELALRLFKAFEAMHPATEGSDADRCARPPADHRRPPRRQRTGPGRPARGTSA